MQQSTPWSEIGANGMSVGGLRLSFDIPAVPVAGILVCEPRLSSENIPTAPGMRTEKPCRGNVGQGWKGHCTTQSACAREVVTSKEIITIKETARDTPPA